VVHRRLAGAAAPRLTAASGGLKIRHARPIPSGRPLEKVGMNETGHRAYALSSPQAMPQRRSECAMCGQPARGAVCHACGAPLALPPRLDDGLEAYTGRRGSPRVTRDDAALWLPAGAERPMAVQLTDLSCSGLRVSSALPVPEGSVARLRTGHLDAVVQTVHCRRAGERWHVHARLLTLRLLQRAGAFVSATA